MNISQAAIDTVGADSESCVIDAQQVQDGGVHIIDLSGLIAIERFVAPFIGGTVADAAANSGTTQPVGEDVRIVIPTTASLG